MSKRDQTLLLIAVTLANFLGAFIVSATNIALPAIQAQFGLSAAGLSWIPLAYVLGTAAALMPMGRVGDMSGHKRTFTWALRAFTAVALATALAPSAGVLIGLRAVLGITSAAVITTSVAIVTFAYPLRSGGGGWGCSLRAPTWA
jgi:MFS family permease